MRRLALVLLAACSPSSDATDGGADDAVVEPEVAAPTACNLATEASIETELSISTGRYAPGAAQLEPGSVFLAGGYDFTTSATATSETVDAVGVTTTPGPKLHLARNFPATALLGDGTWLVAGGFNPSSGSVANAETYDGTTFNVVKGMSHGREAHTATALPDGTALVVGGLQAAGFVFDATAETFDPQAGAFSKTAGDMADKHAFHVAELVDGPRVVVFAGADGPSSETASIEAYDPVSRTFSTLSATLAHPTKALAGAKLADGKVLVAGGSNETDKTLSDAAIFDPQTNTITPAAPMNVRRMAFTLTTLADGRVLAVGGWSDTESPSASTATLEVYDPATNAWTLLAPKLARARHDHVAFLLPDCRVAILAGQSVLPNASPVAPREVELVTVPTKR